MNEYKYKVVLEVSVEAFDQNDALETLQDVFAVGENLGVQVSEAEYQEKR